MVYGDIVIYEDQVAYGDVVVYGDLLGNMLVCEDMLVYGDVAVYEDQVVFWNAEAYTNIAFFSPPSSSSAGGLETVKQTRTFGHDVL